MQLRPIPEFQIHYKNQRLDLSTPHIMGILNVTPDSFSDGGKHNTLDAALRHAEQMIKEGATIIDVGGESTRPNASPVSEQEELDRTVAVVEAISQNFAKDGIWISVDTSSPVVMTACSDAGAGIWNDVRALTRPHAVETAAKLAIPVMLMHMRGEPTTMNQLDNYDNLIRFIRLLSDENGLNISQRNITVSTCGIVPKILKLAEEGLSITLALSLHAPNDEKRQELMPIANKYSMDEVLDACRNYFDKTGRRITFEYSLVASVNDSEEDARQLAGRIKGINCHVNLIPVNPIKERSYVRSTRQAVENFKIKLEKYGINVTIRREMGSDIDGACGQLRKRYMEKTESEK